MAGLSVNALDHVPRGAQQAFLSRAVEFASVEAARARAPAQKDGSDAMRALVRVLKKEDTVVHADPGKRLSDTDLRGLDQQL